MRIMFDTGAACHVCPTWYGREFEIFKPNYILPYITNANGERIRTYGMRTVFLKVVEDAPTIAITFTVCDVTEPIISFFELMERGCSAILQPGDLHLDLNDLTVPLFKEDKHFYAYPLAFAFPDESAMITSTYQENVLHIYYAGMTMRRVSGGNTDY